MTQVRRWFLLVVVISLATVSLATAGCEPARRYPARNPEKPAAVKEKNQPSPDLTWLEPQPTYSPPIIFVPDTDKQWATLPRFWNRFPADFPPAATSHLGLSPLGAAVALVFSQRMEKILIKVPRGLPDPTPSIPKANPPTLANWELGKKLFFDKVLTFSKYDSMACAGCHEPRHGFTEDWASNRLGKKNTPGLINCVYNKHQFWDGRARFLEQTIIRQPEDENLPPEKRPGKHRWGGLVQELTGKEDYDRRFREAFGIRHATQDAIAKALATYMRTILSGDSVYDRAEQERRKRGDKELAAAHFKAVLDDAALKGLEQTKKSDAAAGLVQGYQLFHGKARCVLCHPGPVFTDHDFHNIGLEENDLDLLRIERVPSEEEGRFAWVPIGLKESRLLGAFKTPTLRALPRTAPYMHNGKFKTLQEVVDHFDHGINESLNEYLAPQLRGPHQSLTLEEVRALVLFLRSLDGGPVDALVATP